MKEERPPRLSTELTEEQSRRLNEILEWGEQKKLIATMVNSVIEAYDKHGKMAIYALILGKVSIIDVMRKQEVDQDGNT